MRFNKFRWTLWVFFFAGCASGQQPNQPIKVGHDEIMQAVKESDAKIVVVNFWSTWCAPCVEEFPELVRFGKEHGSDGVKVIFVSADMEDEIANVQQFLQKQGISGKSYLAVGDQNELIQAFNSDWSGGMPATFIFDGQGKQLDFWEGKTTLEGLTQKVGKFVHLNP